MILTLLTLLLLLKPMDGGNHPRKEEMKSKIEYRDRGFHPGKE